MYTRSIYLSLRAQVAVGTFFMKSPVALAHLNSTEEMHRLPFETLFKRLVHNSRFPEPKRDLDLLAATRLGSRTIGARRIPVEEALVDFRALVVVVFLVVVDGFDRVEGSKFLLDDSLDVEERSYSRPLPECRLCASRTRSV